MTPRDNGRATGLLQEEKGDRVLVNPLPHLRPELSQLAKSHALEDPASSSLDPEAPEPDRMGVQIHSLLPPIPVLADQTIKELKVK